MYIIITTERSRIVHYNSMNLQRQLSRAPLHFELCNIHSFLCIDHYVFTLIQSNTRSKKETKQGTSDLNLKNHYCLQQII